MIRILYIVRNLEPGGAETFLLSMLQQLDKRRFTADVACLYGSGQLEAEFARAGVRIHMMGFNALYDLRAYLRLARLVRKNRYDIIHTKLFHADLVGRLIALGVGLRPVYSTVESVHEWVGPQRLRGRFKHIVARCSSRINERVIAVSEDIRKALISNVRLPSELVEVIPNGVDTRHFDPSVHGHGSLKAELGLPPRALLIGAVGTLSPVKNHRLLIEAAPEVIKHHPHAYFVVVGRGDQTALRDLARSYGVEQRFFFTGARRDVANVLASLDAYVMTSLSEGVSLSLLEAMAMARPVIATGVGGNVEIVNSRDLGILYPPNDHNALAHAIDEVLTNRPYRELICRNARRRVCNAYSLGVAVDRYQALYEARK
ncbi:glycosyl transferase [Sulfurifustis variabilis]|uniref:Glycosyl transferase n=1 Tax=Sulfurifustis variabilis TaxID=1675686 RepID=A0A1B4VBJ2_9GAMM|nr:glycosyltransferase [Sulfurifustis variabilis]BAU48031.1 glycosyl transferase [Sulfurifustis variabilis]